MTSYAAATARAEMTELRRLRGLLPPELQSWVTIEGTTGVNPPLITCEEMGKDEVEIQIDLVRWDQLAIDQRNLLFWHEVGRIQNDTIPKDGWEMAALAIGLGGAVGELWVQDGLLLLLALGLCAFSGYRLYKKIILIKSFRRLLKLMRRRSLWLLVLDILYPMPTKVWEVP
jgi:hypothetical protein